MLMLLIISTVVIKCILLSVCDRNNIINMYTDIIKCMHNR